MKPAEKNTKRHSPALRLDAAVSLDDEQFRRLADVPPEVEWFANLTNPNTRRAYRSDVRGFMTFLGIAKPEELRRVRRPHVIAWRKSLEHSAPATVRRKLAAVSSLFDHLSDQNAVDGNPTSGVSRPNEGSNEGKTPAISDAQARKLLDAPVVTTLQGLRDRAIISVFLFHGIRRAEGSGLKVGSLADRRGVPHFTIYGKGSKIRYLPAHPVAVAAVKEYLEAAGHAADKTGPMFRPIRNRTSDAGTKAALTPDSIWRIVVFYGTKVGIDVDGFGPHSLRATAGTNALEHGADLGEVADWFGHASITTTRLYDKRAKRVENSPTFKVSY